MTHRVGGDMYTRMSLYAYQPKHGPIMGPIWNQNRPNMVPTRAQYGPKHGPFMGPDIGPSWVQARNALPGGEFGWSGRSVK
jgi:hypothetical protein